MGNAWAATIAYAAEGRLTGEVRDNDVNARDYDWTYVYDAGGNRELKKEAKNISVNPLQRFDSDHDYGIDEV